MMVKKINANYAFVFYDVNEKRVTKVFKVCKQYLEHYQNSVFRGNITPSKIMKLKKELESITHEEEDFVSIITCINESVFDEIEIGNAQKEQSIFL